MRRSYDLCLRIGFKLRNPRKPVAGTKSLESGRQNQGKLQ